MTLIIFKKGTGTRGWPRLSKTSLLYVKTDFSRCTWEGDESGDEDGLTDIINMDMDGSLTGTKGGKIIKQVFSL
jgi:hypothetical protein